MVMVKEAGTDQVGERLLLPCLPLFAHSDEAESDSLPGTRPTTVNQCLPPKDYLSLHPLRLRHLSDRYIYPTCLSASHS